MSSVYHIKLSKTIGTALIVLMLCGCDNPETTTTKRHREIMKQLDLIEKQKECDCEPTNLPLIPIPDDSNKN